MKKLSVLLAAIGISFTTLAQNQAVTWGEEFKLSKGSTNFTVIHSDYSGVYFQEVHVTFTATFLGSLKESALLVKLDTNLVELFRNDFDRELKGMEFLQFFPYKDKLLIFASEYQKTEKTVKIFGAEVDKSNGSLKGIWKPITSFIKEDRKAEVRFKVLPNSDTSRIILISTISGKRNITYQVQEFDNELEAITKPAFIQNEFEEKTYELEDVLYTTDQKIILLGRIYEYLEEKKKKEKYLDFVNYNIRIYEKTGKLENELNTNIDGKWLTSTKILMSKDNTLIFAGFYSDLRKGNTTDGLLVQRIDYKTGKTLNSTDKPLNKCLFSVEMTENNNAQNGDKEKNGEESQEKLSKDDKVFSRNMKFRNVFYTPDNGIILLAENFNLNYRYFKLEGISLKYNYFPADLRRFIYNSNEITIMKIDASNNISWVKILPKSQTEAYTVPERYISFFSDKFWSSATLQFHSGFGAIQTDSNIHIYFNDDEKNFDIIQPGQKVANIDNYSKSNCYQVTLDQVTGALQRKSLFSNQGHPAAMLLKSKVLGNQMFIVGMTSGILIKTRIRVGKISVK